MDDETPAYISERRANTTGNAAALDGKAILAARAEKTLNMYGPELAAQTLAEVRGECEWPTDVRRGVHSLPFDWSGRPRKVTVALVPAEAGWQVPVVLDYGAWNDYPAPAEHAAILRYWHDRYAADLVALTGTTAEFAVGRPPTTRLEALAFAWEYFVYNDGHYDMHGAMTLTELAASLIDAPTWIAWWD